VSTKSVFLSFVLWQSYSPLPPSFPLRMRQCFRARVLFQPISIQ